jgi:hypothetical protein
MPSFEINIKTTDDPRGLQNATEETIKLTDAMGKLLERAQRREEYAAAKEAIAQMSAEERQAALEAYRLEQAQRAANATIAETGPNAQAAGGYLASLKSGWIELYGAIGVAEKAFQIGQTIWQETGGVFMELADQTRALQEAIGATSEEASALIAIADDVQISADDIQRAFESAIRRGIDPSVEGLMQLGEEFRSIQDPVEQTRFLMDTFGRTGADLRRLLELDAEAMREMAEEARETGQILSEEQMRMAQAYREASDNLGDAWGKIKLQAGSVLVPAVADAMNASLKYSEALETEAKWLLSIPVIGNAYLAWLAVQEGQTRKNAAANEQMASSLNQTATAIERVVVAGQRGNYYIPGTLYNPNAVQPGDPNYNPTVWYGNRAAGGPVQAGRLYTINENKPWSGPEVFLAPADGMIYPSAQAAGRALGGQQVVVQVDNRSIIGLRDRYEAEQELIPLIEQALRQVNR